LSRYVERFDKRIDPKGRPYYWMDGDKITDDLNGCTDDKAINDDYISITPINYDLTDREYLAENPDWGFGKC